MLALDYSVAATLAVIGLGPVFAAWGRALRADSTLQERYQDRRASTTAAISGGHVVPLVARIVVAVYPRISWPILGRPGAEHIEAVESQLLSVGFLAQLDRLTPPAADAADCQRLQDEVKRWLWGQAWAAAPYTPCAMFLIAKVSSDGMELPSWLYWLAALIGSCAVCIWLVFLGLEIATRNRMARIFRRYE